MDNYDKMRWEIFRSIKKSRISKDEFKLICELHSRYKKHRYYEPCSCSPKKINQWISDINKIYDNE